MTVKAACSIIGVYPDPGSPGDMRVYLAIAGLDTTQVTANLFLTGVAPTISSVLLEQALKQAVKDELTNNHGYTFGIFDSVRLLTATL